MNSEYRSIFTFDTSSFIIHNLLFDILVFTWNQSADWFEVFQFRLTLLR